MAASEVGPCPGRPRPAQGPGAVTIVDEIPKTVTGKVLRLELRDKEAGAQPSG
jgi:acyl-coenzyme A synthetase/AMP-(fatty) acid ligase